MTILLVLSSVSDLKQYRIPNDLIVAGWLVALLLRWYEQGLVGVGAGVCCVLLGTAALLPMFCIRGMGAGDIKLLSVIAGMYGMKFWVHTGIVFAVLAAVASLLHMLGKRQFLERMKYFVCCAVLHRRKTYYDVKRDGYEMVIPLAPLAAMADYFGRKNFLLDSRLFTKLESLNEFLKDRQPDVLLLGEDVDRTGVKYLDRARHLVIMSEGNGVAEGGETCPLIFKYQSAEKILQEIFQILEEGEGASSVTATKTGGQTEFIGIYRPYGAPVPLQRLLPEVKDRRQSILVDLELFGEEQQVMKAAGSAENSGMSEVIFYLKQHSEKLAAKLRRMITQCNGMDYLGAVEDFRDLYTLCREDVDRLLSLFAHETGYERVVFDVGFLTDSSLYLLYCCDRIYIPRAQSRWEEQRRAALERLLVREGLEEVIDNIQYV